MTGKGRSFSTLCRPDEQPADPHLKQTEMLECDRLALQAAAAVDMNAASARVGQSPLAIWFQAQLRLLARDTCCVRLTCQVQVHLQLAVLPLAKDDLDMHLLDH